MSSKRSSSIIDGTMRSISAPGRCTRTDFSFPISEVTWRLIGREKRGILPDGPAPPGRAAGSGRRQERQRRGLGVELLARAIRDAVQPRGEPVERAARFRVLLLRVRQVDAELRERLLDLPPEPRQLRELLADLARVLLELEPAQPHRDRREV